MPDDHIRLVITDSNNNIKFLIDTGASVSALPPLPHERHGNPTHNMCVANGDLIANYGTKTLTLNLGLRRSFTWIFHIVDVDCPIIGADFIREFKLLPDLSINSLIDKTTGLSTPGGTTSVTPGQYALTPIIKADNKYKKILEKLPEITNPNLKRQTTVPHNTTHHIITRGPPCFCRPRRLAPDKYHEAKAEFERMQATGVVRPSKSPWASPLTIVPKKNATSRMCGDYRALNARTVRDSYPIPHLHDFTSNLSGATKFTKIDLAHAYTQIPVNPPDIEKTAITTPFGLYEYLFTPYGLCGAAQTFQRFMTEVTNGMDRVFCYIDDLLVASPTEEQHLKDVEELLTRLRNYGIVINPDKCEFGMDELEYLGHHISKEGVRPTEDKVRVIRDIPLPKTQTDLRSFLGSINFYHRFLPKIAKTLAPLHALITQRKRKSKLPVKWTPEAEHAFHDAKTALANAVTLEFPKKSAQLDITTDASDTAIGCVLQQTVNGQTTPLAFFSQKLSPTERRYSAFGRELLAIYRSIRHFKHYVEGRHFTVYTDHQALTRAIDAKTDRHSPRESRQLSYIAQFTTDIRYTPGLRNIVADYLSRLNGIRELSHTPDTSVLTNHDPETWLEDSPDVHFTASVFRDQQKADGELQHCINQHREEWNIRSIEGIDCDTQLDFPRALVPRKLRRLVFNGYHNLAHPGVRRTRKLIAERYVWPAMHRDITRWTRECISCQQSKIHRHNKAPLQPMEFKGRKFDAIHVDLIGPMDASGQCAYALTMIDRMSRWPEACPIPDISAETVARALVTHWISRYGVPLSITTDRGAQFTSQLWTQLNQLMGTERRPTTAYHPQSNGLVERFNRDLKTALTTMDDPTNWTDHLPLILLALRSQYKPDLKATSAEAVYGCTLRLPHDMVDGSLEEPAQSATVLPDYIRRLRNTMSQMTYTPPRLPKQNSYVDPHLQECTHVFVRVDRHKPPLRHPYEGPFRVHKRKNKYFHINRNGRYDKVSVDRLKAAYLPTTADSTTTTSTHTPTTPPCPIDTDDEPNIQICYPSVPTIATGAIPKTPTATKPKRRVTLKRRPEVREYRTHSPPDEVSPPHKYSRYGRALKPTDHYKAQHTARTSPYPTRQARAFARSNRVT